MVFFSFREEKETKQTEYRLCAVATVSKKVRMTDFWEHPAFSRYQSYHNLLIKPKSRTLRCWKHFEPKLKGQKAHDDWLWRICEHPKGIRKESFEGREEFCLEERIKGHRIVVAENYIIFSTRPEETHVLSSPHPVAWYTKGNDNELWGTDPVSVRVHRLTLQEANRVNLSNRFLRVPGGGGHPHRHVRWKAPREEAVEWRNKIIAAAKG